MEKHKCAIGGQLSPRAMCGAIIVGGVYCGHDGECGHKVAEHEPKHCTYPKCNCPFDAPADPNWCARGLPHKQRGFGAPDFTGIVVAMVVIGFFIGTMVWTFLPWLWNLLKPWLHSVTG